MTDMQSVKEYVDRLPEETRFIAEAAIKEMRENGCTWEWLNTALNIKSKEDWIKYGFGLFFTDTFKAQVQKKIQQKKRRQINSIWMEDKAEESINVGFGNPIEEYEQIKYGTRTYELKARTIANKNFDEMSEEDFASMVIKQHRDAALYCARYFPQGGFSTTEALLEKYEHEDKSGIPDIEIAKRYLLHH